MDKRLSLTMATLICIIPVAIFWAIVLIPGLAQTIWILISLSIAVAWIVIIAFEIKIFKEMSK